MKILFLANWKIKKCNEIPKDLQPADYIISNEKFWFFKYFPKDTEIEVIDITSTRKIEKFEKDILHLHILQTLKALKEIKKYDVVISHGITSAIFLDLIKRIFHLNILHIVFDIHSFNSASETGVKLKIIQFASKAIDGLIYHSSQQIEYYRKHFPWIVDKSQFIPYGTNIGFLEKSKKDNIKKENFIISIGYNLRDNYTLIKAFLSANLEDTKLKIIGNVEEKFKEKSPKIVYQDAMSIDRLNEEIQKAKFCILPLENKNYSFGQMTLLQQLYYNKAVITANVPSVKDYVEDGKTAILYEAGNVEDLKNKILELNNNMDLINTLEKNSQKSVIENYNEEIMARRIYEFLKKVEEENLNNI